MSVIEFNVYLRIGFFIIKANMGTHMANYHKLYTLWYLAVVRSILI